MKRLSITLVVIFALILSATVSAKQLESSFLLSLGEKGDGPGQFNSPQSLSSDANGNIYVLDTGNNRIQKFTPTGKLLTFIGGFGWDQGQFQLPVDIFVYNSLDIFVADYENNRIERYDKDLNWLASYYSNRNWNSKYQFYFPTAVCLSLHGDFFIADSENDRIIKYNASFEPELSFGDYDWGRGVLSEPSDIFISNQDVVYITDSEAAKVMVYDYFGNFIQEFGAEHLSNPQGVYVDEIGHVFVADSDQHAVFVFDRVGTLVLRIGSFGNKYGAFNEPYDVSVTRDLLFVADTGNHRVQVFQLQWQE